MEQEFEVVARLQVFQELGLKWEQSQNTDLPMSPFLLMFKINNELRRRSLPHISKEEWQQLCDVLHIKES